jgi:hypothetical protein
MRDLHALLVTIKVSTVRALLPPTHIAALPKQTG